MGPIENIVTVLYSSSKGYHNNINEIYRIRRKKKSFKVTEKSTVYENKIFDIVVQHDMI